MFIRLSANKLASFRGRPAHTHGSRGRDDCLALSPGVVAAATGEDPGNRSQYVFWNRVANRGAFRLGLAAFFGGALLLYTVVHGEGFEPPTLSV